MTSAKKKKPKGIYWPASRRLPPPKSNKSKRTLLSATKKKSQLQIRAEAPKPPLPNAEDPRLVPDKMGFPRNVILIQHGVAAHHTGLGALDELKPGKPLASHETIEWQPLEARARCLGDKTYSIADTPAGSYREKPRVKPQGVDSSWMKEA
jgi:hypothetical protein